MTRSWLREKKGTTPAWRDLDKSEYPGGYLVALSLKGPTLGFQLKS